MNASSKFSRLSALAFAVAAVSAAPAMATNGYFTHGVGTHSKAMAGAGDAMPDMAIDVANNPAAGVLVDEHLDLGLALFSPSRSYSTTDSLLNGQMGAFTLNTDGTVDSDNDIFYIPYVAKNWHLSETQALTLAFYGRGGMNTEYVSGGTATFDPDGPGPAPVMTLPGTYGAGVAGVNLNQAFLELAFSAEVADGVVVGISPMVVYQTFEAKGVATFAPYTKSYVEAYINTGMGAMPENLTNNGVEDSWGVGLKAGVIWNVTDAFALQARYQTRVDMSEFDEYSDLFAEKGDFDIPATASVGMSWAATERFKIHFDVEQTFYNDVASVGNPLTNVAGCPTAGQGGQAVDNCLGGSNGFGFGWDDVTVYQFGMEWDPAGMEGITWRVGYNYGEQPIAPENVSINILAPATVEEHFTAGFCLDLSNEDHISVALMYAPEKEVTGPNLFDPTQNVSVRMDQWEVEFAYTF